ncbi:MAG: Ig-like domain-containing protein [Bacteroidetes bacterium]|nr:Ig-like domain-containing protein [Bacteroidota bacterium]MCY4204489.1 Ig-like domain-containing protein [Bacteroidota bacterium]
MLLLLVGLFLQVNPQAEPPEHVKIMPESITLEVNETREFLAEAYDASGAAISGLEARWHIAESTIATVDENGKVQALAPGRAVIVAVLGGKPGYAEIIVEESNQTHLIATLPSSSLLSGTSMSINVLLNGLPTEERIRFRSSNVAVVTVNRDGRVHAHKPGTANVTVRVADVSTTVDVTVIENPAVSYQIAQNRYIVRQGDVVRFRVNAVDENGDAVEGVYPTWEASGGGLYMGSEGAEGIFVPEEALDYSITAHIGEDIQRTIIIAVEPRVHKETLMIAGRGAIAHHHSGDMWAFEGVDGRDYVYIGTFIHDWMKVFDVTNPEEPVLTDSIQVDARRINDVKIHGSNQLAVITREGASSRRNGIVILDLSNPAHPTILSEYTETVTGGVHNVWIEEDLVYACHNGTSALHIIDISDPVRPKEVGRWELDKEEKTLHDVIVQEGYAYLSYWDDGVVTLDVGAGTHGGTPTAPVMVSRLSYPEGNTHVAWRHGQYLFVGDEIFPEDWDPSKPIDARGYIHILDVSDLEAPVEVARYEIPGAGAHNVWVEDDRLYVGYYQAGLRVIDISGELRGNLYNQGREIAHVLTADEQSMVPGWPMTWGAQIFKGHIYTSDLNSGLWIARMDVVRP